MMLRLATIHADYNVIVGTINTYDVNTSNCQLTWGTKSAIGTGYEINGTSFTEGTQFDVKVINSSTWIVYWNMTAGTMSFEYYNYDLIDNRIFLFLIQLPIFYANIGPLFNLTSLEIGLPIFISLFFTNVPIISKYFCTPFTNETYISEEFIYLEEWTFNQIAGHFDNSTNIIIFDWVLNSRYYNSSTVQIIQVSTISNMFLIKLMVN